MKRRLVILAMLAALAAGWFGVRGDDFRQLRLVVVALIAEARQLELADGETRVMSLAYGTSFEGAEPERADVRAVRRGERLTLTVITGPAELRGGELVFRVVTGEGQQMLTCSGTTIAAHYLPKECRQ